MGSIKDIHANYDAVLKDALTLYQDETLDFLGLGLARVKEPIVTEFTDVIVDKNSTDIVG